MWSLWAWCWSNGFFWHAGQPETLTDGEGDWSHESEALVFDVSRLPQGPGGRGRGGIGISAQDFGIVVSKRSLLGQVNFSLCVSVCVGLHIGNPQLRPGSWRMKGRFIFVHISPLPFTYNNTQPAVHGSDLSHEHTYYNIGVDISRPVELVLVARLWPVWVTGLMGSLWKEWCCMPCAAWTQPLGPDMSRLKWR